MNPARKPAGGQDRQTSNACDLTVRSRNLLGDEGSPTLESADALEDVPTLGRGGRTGTMKAFKQSLNRVIRERGMGLRRKH